MWTLARLRIQFIAAGLLLALSTAAVASDIAYPEPGDALPGRPGLTYLDLVRLVVPDIAAVGEDYEGHRLAQMRRIDDDTPPTPVDPIRLSRLSALSLGKDRLLLLLDLGPSEDEVAGVVPLALFDIGSTPRLVDAIHVALDRNTSLRETPLFSLGKDHLAVTTSSHFNSSQGYAADAMLLVGDDSVATIDTVYTFSDAGCGFRRTQTPSYRVKPRGAHADIKVRVDETTERTDDECADQSVPKPGHRSIDVTYRWDAKAQRYRPDSEALERLAAENEERF
jgi:hypothetical protein